MAVENGGPVEASYTNSKLLSRTQDSSTIGRVGLLNTSDPNSGNIVNNAQRAINKSFETLGIAGEADTLALQYASQERIVDGETFKQSIEKLDQAFNETSGHNHSGPGQGGQISALTLSNFNPFVAGWQVKNILGVSGTSFDVSLEFTTESPDGSDTSEGVITFQPSNRVYVYDAAGNAIEDAEGQRVFGKLEHSLGVWTLDFYTREAGLDVPHDLQPAQEITFYYLKVFSVANRPTIPSDPNFGGTVDLTGDVVDASATQRGLVSTSTQEFAGPKTFLGDVTLSQNLFVAQAEASTVSSNFISDQAATVIEITDPMATDLDGIDTSLGPNKILIVVNKTGNTININQGAPTDGFLISGGGPILLDNGCAILCRRDDPLAAWQVIGGGGGAVTGFANDTLSNLVGPTAINQDLMPDSDNTRQMGDNLIRWANINTIQSNVYVPNADPGSIVNDNDGNAMVTIMHRGLISPISPGGGYIDGPLPSTIVATGKKDLVLYTHNDSGTYGDVVASCGYDGVTGFEGIFKMLAKSAKLPQRTVDPSSPEAGWIYYNTTTNKIRWYNGTQWGDLGAGGFDLQNITSSTTLTQSANYFTVDATSGNVVLTINPANRFRYSIKRTDASANLLSIVPSSGLIDGATVFYVNNQYDSIEVYADGTNLWVF